LRTHKLGWRLIGAFLIFGACMLALTAIMLLMPATSWSAAVWSLRPGVRGQLEEVGWPIAVCFSVLSCLFIYAAACWFLRRKIGWVIASLLIVCNLLGDLAQLFFGRVIEGSVGIIFGGLLFAYMTSPWIRGIFYPDIRTQSGDQP